MNGWHLSAGLLVLLGYVFHRMSRQVAWERKHHEEAVGRWRQERTHLARLIDTPRLRSVGR